MEVIIHSYGLLSVYVCILSAPKKRAWTVSSEVLLVVAGGGCCDPGPVHQAGSG